MKAPRFYGSPSSIDTRVRSAGSRHRWLVVPITALGLTLPHVAFAQTTPKEDPIATFPEQSNNAAVPAQPTAVPAQPTVVTAAPTETAPATPAPTAVTPAAPAPVTIAPPRPAQALETSPAVRTGPSREGFFLRFGSGPTFLRLKGTGPNGSASVSGLGSAMSIAIGGGITRGLVLAGTIHGTSTSSKFKGGPFTDATITTGARTIDASDVATGSIAEIGVLLDYYPEVTQGWHVGLGAGLGSLSVVNSADSSTYYASGIGALLQGGYEWHLGKDWCLGLNLIAAATTKGDLKESDHQKKTGYSMRGFSVGIESALVYF